jgi:hypothetical protein
MARRKVDEGEYEYQYPYTCADPLVDLLESPWLLSMVLSGRKSVTPWKLNFSSSVIEKKSPGHESYIGGS